MGGRDKSQANGVPCAIDLSHHINAKSKARHPSPLKDIIKFMGCDGMISLAGGLPHPSLFPFTDLVFTASSPTGAQEDAMRLHVNSGTKPNLATWLQYGSGAGHTQLRDWCQNFTKEVLQPAYKDYEILCHPGNTNAWSKVVGMLLEEGDHVLCEDFTYPSSQALWIPLGNYAAPIAMDEQGMRDDALEEVLSMWETTHPGVRRPHVLYTVPVGSNPSGITYSAGRKQKLYEICVKYDIILVEDDPYYFLQFPSYDFSDQPTEQHKQLPNSEFIQTLIPSFLRYDYQGRVIRLESFSKSLAPGLRLGYFIANPTFTEKLLRATEVETQDPAGLSQAVVLSLLEEWKLDGYLTWLQNIRIQYQKRCEWMIHAFTQHFDLVPAAKFPELKARGVVAVMKSTDGSRAAPVFSFVSPAGGMFIWTKFYLASNRSFKQHQSSGAASADPEQAFANELWAHLAEEKVLLTPGSYYYPWQGEDKTSTAARGADAETTQFRFSFALVTKEDMETGIARFAKVIRASWSL